MRSSQPSTGAVGILLNSFGIPWNPLVGLVLKQLESFGRIRTRAVGILWNLLSSSELLSSSWSILGALGLESISSLVLNDSKNVEKMV